MEYADEVWDYFQRLYKPETKIGANGVISRKKFYAMQLKEGENISNFLAEVYGHAQDLRVRGLSTIKDILTFFGG